MFDFGHRIHVVPEITSGEIKIGHADQLPSTCYSEIVKNITVSLPDEEYRQARVIAAERDTSVSALVRQYLLSLQEQE